MVLLGRARQNKREEAKRSKWGKNFVRSGRITEKEERKCKEIEGKF